MDEQLHRLAATVSRAESLEEMVRPLLTLLQRMTRLESTYLTRIDRTAGFQHVLFSDNQGKMNLPEGLVVPWENTVCRRALEQECYAISDARERWKDLEAVRELGIQTYISTPVRTGEGDLYGTLCAASSDSVNVQQEEVGNVFRLFAELIGSQIDREQRTRRAEKLASEMAFLSEIGDLCLNAQSLHTAVTEAARLVNKRGAWQQAVPFLFDGQDLQALWNDHAEFTASLLEIVGDTQLIQPDVEGRVHGELLPVPIDHPGVTTLREAANVSATGVTALLTVSNQLGPRAGIVLVSDDAPPISDGEARLLKNCSSYLSLVAERLEHVERLSRHAMHDPLTGLPNRRYLVEATARMLANASRDDTVVHVAFIDLDDFKAINDTHGHEVGDQFLKAFSARLSGTVRAGDLASRYGGDEFVVLAVGADQESASLQRNRLAERLSAATTGIYETAGVTVDYAGPSIGVITCGGDETDADQVLASADKAMYAVKETRRHREG